MTTSPSAKRQRTAEAARQLASNAPRISLTPAEDDNVDLYVMAHFANERARFHAINKDENLVWREPKEIAYNLMTHQISAELGVCELLEMTYLPRHFWKERREMNILRRDTTALLIDDEVRIDLRILGGANGIYLNLDDVHHNRYVLWAETRLVDCDCALCSDAEPRPETRVRLLGGVKADKELYYKGAIVQARKNDKERFIPAELLISPYELEDADGIPLVEKP
jgi:hypothetical protein